MVRSKGVTAEVPTADHDRRQAPRVLVDFEVDYASEDNYLFAYITDISTTGIFVRTTTPEQPGTHLNLRLAEGGARRPEIGAGGVWANPARPGPPDTGPPGVGVGFVTLDSESRARLFGLIRRFAYLS